MELSHFPAADLRIDFSLGKTYMDDKKERLRQTIVILKKLTEDLGIPYESPEVQELKQHLSAFVVSGEPWKGSVDFSRWDRIAHITCKKSGSIDVRLQSTIKT
jgi:hypothetical protein